MHIFFIGGGNMAEAIIASLLNKKVVSPSEIAVSDVLPARLDYLYEKYGVETCTNNLAGLSNADVVVLAVKPQILSQAMSDLKGKLTSQLVLSIVAGASLEKIRAGLGHKKIVRSMPNTPAQIGMGMTVWIAAPEVTKLQCGQARSILRVMGQEIKVDDEKYLDMATAVSGSGPAYFFYFIEAFIAAAEKLGWSSEDAAKMVIQTAAGAVELVQKSGKKPAELRKAVTSPGGTTAAAIAQMEKDNLTDLISRAVEAAHLRAQELGK